MLPIAEVGAQIGLSEEALEAYGKYKAKVDLNQLQHLNRKAKLVLVTAINPTPAGEGKTTTSIGLADAIHRLGKKSVLALREPSLGPVFGLKGGAAGGGYAQVLPMEDINLHFTGDFHAIGAANNLLAAMLDNHIQQGNALGIDPRRIVWKRAVDMNDRALRHTVIGLGSPIDGIPREDSFQITVASEIMAIFCLSQNVTDLKERLSRIIVAYTRDRKPITAHDLKAEGAMCALLKDALRPNLVQTIEHTPAFAALCKDGASCAEAAFFVAGFLDEPVFGFRIAREFIDGDHARQMVDVTDVFDVAQEIGKTLCESGKVFPA